MKSTLQFLAYVISAYGLAALLLVILNTIFKDLSIIATPEHIMQRGGMLFIILSFWPWLNYLQLADCKLLGYNIARSIVWKSVTLGFVAGLSIALILNGILLWLGVRALTPGIALSRLPSIIISGLLTGITTALIEETFFRGALFAAIRRSTITAIPAILGSSLLYSVLHVLRPQPWPPGTSITLIAAFNSIWRGVTELLQSQHLDTLSALLLLGILLSLIRERTGHLGWGIGLHAGLILVVKLSHNYTDVAYDSPWIASVSTYDGITGWLAAVWIGIIVLAIAYRPQSSLINSAVILLCQIRF